MRLDDERYEFIKGEVVALFERYDVRCIPISGFELAHKMGIRLIPYSSQKGKKHTAVMRISEDGFYMEDMWGNNIIYYNDERPYERVNMTILHEIGHCVLDHTGESEEEEAEANFFAKYALAPPPLVHRIQPHGPEDIEAAFGISYEASVYAYEYYWKRRNYGVKALMEYERQLLFLFLPTEFDKEVMPMFG